MIVTEMEVRVALNLAESIGDGERALLQLIMPTAHAAIRQVLGYDPEQKSHTEVLPLLESLSFGEESVWESNGRSAYLVREAAQVHRQLQLTHVPIRSVSALYEDTNAEHGAVSGSWSNATKLTEGVDFTPEYDQYDEDANALCTSGILRRINGAWTNVPGSIKVTYTAGYSAGELNGTSTVDARPIKDAILMTCVKEFRQFRSEQKSTDGTFKSGQVVSEKLGDYYYQLSQSESAQLNYGFAVSVSPQARLLLQRFMNYGAFLG